MPSGIASLGFILGAVVTSARASVRVLATLGLRPRQWALILRWQALTIAIVAVLVGVPAGLIAGRVVWAAIANSAGVAVSHATPVGALVGGAAFAVLAAGTIAAGLLDRVRRRRLADLLRAD